MAAMAGRRVGKLTARFTQTVKKTGLYGDGGGLYLKVGGSKSWIFRHQVRGEVKKYGLGPLHTVSLSDARARAEAVRRQLLDGIDPRQARRDAQIAAVKSISFDDAADRYIEAHTAGWKSRKSMQQWRSSLATYASPIFGKLPVSAVDTGLVMRVLGPIWSSKHETAHRVRGRIESILSWAKVRGFREGENPAQWRGHLDHLLPPRDKVHKIEHHPALPYLELPDFMRELRQRDGVAALALEFLILTATRTSETLDAAWSEFDLTNQLWTIPPVRMKGAREHRVPLSDRAVLIVAEMQKIRHGDFVFPGARRGRPLGDMSMLQTLSRMDRGDLTTHGFRATFKTWATERTNYQREVIETALAHVVGDKVEEAYQRGDLLDKRRRLMESWSAFCDSRVTDNVVAIR
jgi:integrase